MLIKSYTYKGPVLEWYMRVKVRLERSYELLRPHRAARCGGRRPRVRVRPLSYMLAMLCERRRVVGMDYDAEKGRDGQPELPAAAGHRVHPRRPAHGGAARADAFLLVDVLHYMRPEEQRALIGRCAARLNAGGRIIIRDGDSGRPSGTRPRR